MLPFLTSFFTKQRVLVLGTAIVATNLLVSRRVIEGMDHDGKEGEDEEEEEEEAETEGMGGIEEISGGNGRIDLAATKKKTSKTWKKR